MKSFCGFWIVLLFFASLSAKAGDVFVSSDPQNSAVISDLDRQLFQRLDRLFQVFSLRADAIWDDSFRLDKIPLLLVYRDSSGKDHYGYLINHPKANELPHSKPIVLGSSFNALSTITQLNHLPRSTGLKRSEYAEFQWDIAGVPTLVIFYTNSTQDGFNIPTTAAWDAFLIHEALHHQQEGVWKQRDDEIQNAKDYPLGGREEIAHIFLESEALLDAISATTAAKRQQAIAYFVAVRRARMASHPIVRGMDGMQERYEGTSHYTEHRLKDIMPNDSLPDITGLLRGNLSEQNNRLSLALGRFYVTGAALSMLLDKLEIEWKPLMEAGATHYELLHQWLGESQTDWEQLLVQARVVYNYPELLEKANIVVKRL